MPSTLDEIVDTIGNITRGAIDIGQQVLSGDAPSNTGQAPGNDFGQSQYDFRYTVFPSDLGVDSVGHYMVININVPTKGIKTDGRDLGTPAGAYGNYFTPLNQVSKVDQLRYSTTPTPGAPNAVNRNPLAIPRNTRRIAESIALHMPAALVHTHQNYYEDIELTALGGKLGVAAQKAIGAGMTATRLAQAPINPAVEILYANTPQRQYVFEVLLAPRNEIESRTIKTIVQTLKFHGSPEINPLTYGFTWIPPAEFDITFFTRGQENTNILRINTCVLERLDVDYSPQGVYSTFRNGHPVAVRLSMGFRELEPLHKQRVLQGF